MSRIVTFYSYKGGVGRTFALANIAVLLAKRGKRVLVMDWDVEAPGLHRYFQDYLPKESPLQQGLIHLLHQARKQPNTEWQPFVVPVQVENYDPISLIYCGDQAPEYVELVRTFSWTEFFEHDAGGTILERWRREWKEKFDFVLVDSRTGITDSGGVCTILLPDILVLVFSANEQSFERGKQVAIGVQESRRSLAVPRPPAAILPVPGRFDGRDEVDAADRWLDRFAIGLKPFYDDWLPKRFLPREMLERTKIPYITKFSFGEPLPVVSHGVTDPEFPGFYLDNITRLLASDFEEAGSILDRQDIIAEFRARISGPPLEESEIELMLNAIEHEVGEGTALAELLNEAGLAMLRQNRAVPAESLLRRALALIEREVGPDHPDTAATLNNLADLLRTVNRLAEAEEMYRRALNAAEQRYRPGDSSVAQSYNNLAGVLRDLGRLAEAADVYRQALNAVEHYSRAGDRSIALTYNNLAAVLRELGRLGEAETVYRQALSIVEQDSSTGDRSVAETYNNLAAVLRESGRLAEAEAVYRQALNVVEEYSAPGDRSFAEAYNNLGAVLRESGQLAEAEVMYRQALSVIDQSSRPGDRSVAGIYNNLAVVLRELGHLGEAESWSRQALNIVEQYSHPGDRSVALIYHNLAAVLRQSGRLEEAEGVYRQALDILERYSHPSDPSVAMVLNDLAEIVTSSNHLEEAEVLLRQALAIVEAAFGEDHPDVTKISRNLASVLEAREQSAEALGSSSVKSKIKILVLMADPPSLKPLQLAAEVREIATAIQQTGLRHRLEVVSEISVRRKDVIELLIRHRPNVVHFSGHGGKSGVTFLFAEDDKNVPLSAEALKAIFSEFKDTVRLVFLSSCDTKAEVEAIAEVIDCAVGTDGNISDRAAISFAACFYGAIAYGRTIGEAFNLGKAHLISEGLQEEAKVELLTRQGIDPYRVRLVEADTPVAPSLTKGAREIETDPTGRVYVSYASSRMAELKVIAGALRDRGIPLYEEGLAPHRKLVEDSITTEVLYSPGTASGLILLTPEAVDSRAVKDVELPIMLERSGDPGCFFVVAAAFAGFDLGDAGVSLRSSGVPVHRTSVAMGPKEAAQIANLVLEQRIDAIHRNTPSGEALRLEFYTRTPPSFKPGSALLIDWTERFSGRFATPTVWDENLLPALRDIVNAIESEAPGRPIQMDGRFSLSAAVALGSSFNQPWNISLRQHTTGRRDQIWSIDVPRKPFRLSVKTDSHMPDGSDLAVLISVTTSVEQAFESSLADLPPFRAIVRAWTSPFGPVALASAGQAADAAFKVRDAIREAKVIYPHLRCIHLFMAVPAGFAMMIGQLLSTLVQIQTYEIDLHEETVRYRRAALLNPLN